ncbi:MAG TPA: SDR family NAD(P)-dependent oxidoreductase [Saprospiraceae bacterium]|nr:SDR family NAD(P)-dependent oxidoreductase [Saprospiraceae bacterium]
MSSNKKTALEVVQNQNLEDKVFLITGGYAGLGAASAKALLKAKAKVIIVGRNAETQQKFVADLLNDTSLKISENQIDATKTMDLGDLESVSQFAKYIYQKYEQIDVLMNNAGIMRTPPGKTKDGFEIQMGTNVIGHFLLAKILAPKTKRQVWLSSNGHLLVDEYPGEQSIEKAPRIDIQAITNVDASTYHSWRRYQQSKLGDILLSKQFIKEFPGLYSYSVHPGVVQTNLSKHISFWSQLKMIPKLITGQIKIKKPEDGASTQVYCSVVPVSELENGAYYADCHIVPSSQSSNIAEDAKKLYDFCDEVTKKHQIK